jgi:hypothetical protein
MNCALTCGLTAARYARSDCLSNGTMRSLQACWFPPVAAAAMCVTFFAMTAICGGCSDNKPAVVGGGVGGHPLSSGKGRKCPANATPVDYEFDVVASPAVFADPADRAIVVCENDTVSWSIQSSTGVIKINFTDAFADDLFGKGNAAFQSQSGNPKSATVKQSVKSQKNNPGQVYKYNIVVEDPAGNKKGEQDPHVIPM